MNAIPETICPECGSKRYTLKGFDYARKGTMRKYQCSDCRRYFRDSITEEQKESIRNALASAQEE